MYFLKNVKLSVYYWYLNLWTIYFCLCILSFIYKKLFALNQQNQKRFKNLIFFLAFNSLTATSTKRVWI